MRLNAFLAQAGLASRRGSDELIKAGKVKVNDEVGELNTNVGQNDTVTLDDKPVVLQKLRYILLNKPSNTVTTLSDPQNRKTVVDLITLPERVVPIGRLDYDTTGVLLLTNDGELANRLMHPSFLVDKVYEATVNGDITQEILNKLSIGLKVDGKMTAPAKARKLANNKIELIIHEGRKHQVKKMLIAVSLPVVRLHRSNYAGLGLDDLLPGEWRDLTDEELNSLK